MSEGSKIQWCDDTHNFWRGCVKVSPGCKNCYAEVSTPVRVARSEGRELWGGTLRDRAKDFDAPLRWNEKPWICDDCGTPSRELGKCQNGNCEIHRQIHESYKNTFHRRRVFSLSLGDWLDEAVPIEWLADMLDVIRRCPNLDFLLLTKRPENFPSRIDAVLKWIEADPKWQADVPTVQSVSLRNWLADWFVLHKAPHNVWIGTTVENQEYANQRIPDLIEIPAKVHFVSYEPALGAVDFSAWLSDPILPLIDWIIGGLESGHHARAGDINWLRSARDQCKSAGVKFFCKQFGARPYITRPDGDDAATLMQFPIKLKDKKGGDMAEWPEDLRVREFPPVNS